MIEPIHEYSVTCSSCGNRWRIEAREMPEQLECIGCGADTFDISDLGELRR